MKKSIILALCITTVACTAQEQQQQAPAQTIEQKPQVIYVPVAVPTPQQQNQKLTESQKNDVLFCNLLDILGNFGTVLLNKDNTAVALNGVSNMISGIVSAFHTIITKRNPSEIKHTIINALRTYSDQLEQTL